MLGPGLFLFLILGMTREYFSNFDVHQIVTTI